MAKSILITGGARSGKSALAERLVLKHGPRPVYIATAEPRDTEMQSRIAAHKARRGADWTLIEAPLDLCAALSGSDRAPRLVDCLTLWLSNLMHGGRDWAAETQSLAFLLPRLDHPVVLVTNEVGLGIVPENALARRFRDAAGVLNRTIAETCAEVHLCVAGQPLQVKPAP